MDYVNNYFETYQIIFLDNFCIGEKSWLNLEMRWFK